VGANSGAGAGRCGKSAAKAIWLSPTVKLATARVLMQFDAWLCPFSSQQINVSI
jgi:hypothetical protein